MHDYSLFYNKTKKSMAFVAIYFDDVIIIENDLEEILQLKLFLHNKFKIKDLGQLHYFLGLEMLHRDTEILIS